MATTPIQRVRVWGAGLRASHWILAASVLVLLASGWRLALGHVPAGWRDAHLTSGYLLGLALVFRIALLFTGRTPTDRWRDCLPLTRPQWQGVRDMLLFYVSFGRARPPAWYGHNPLWGPVYLLLFALLAGGTITGLLLARVPAGDALWLAATPGWLGWTLPEWHAGLAQAITGFTGAHVASVFMHDARGTSGEISAMVNGHKTFILPPVPPEAGARIEFSPRRRGGN
jgi:Ni/Fe-hydrogenase 1 B-type cytochrome subunit